MTLGALARLKGFTAFIKSILAPNRVVQSSLYLISLRKFHDFALTTYSFIDLLSSNMEELCVDGGVFYLPSRIEM